MLCVRVTLCSFNVNVSVEVFGGLLILFLISWYVSALHMHTQSVCVVLCCAGACAFVFVYVWFCACVFLCMAVDGYVCL